MAKTRKKSQNPRKGKGKGKQSRKRKSSQSHLKERMMIQNACTVNTFIHAATKGGLLVLNVNNGHTTPVLGLERPTKLLTSHVNCVMMIDRTDS